MGVTGASGLVNCTPLSQGRPSIGQTGRLSRCSAPSVSTPMAFAGLGRRHQMAYVSPNFKTKKGLKAALADNYPVEVYQPGLGTVPANGRIALEGPHYPEPHRWYAEGTMQDGRLVKIA